MLPIDVADIRLFLHVLAATVWVGGQLTLGGLVPKLRAISPDAPRIAARQFNRIAWPAFGVLVITGIWNLLEVEIADQPTEYHATLGLKLLMVALSAGAAAVHVAGRSKKALAIGGAVAALTSILAVFLGIVLH